jgi:uncharacterized protein DUF5063
VAEDFANAAARFCSVIEQAGGLARARWLAEVERALSDVYASAVGLPAVGLFHDGPGGSMSSDEWSELYAALKSKIGSEDQYWHVLDPGNQASLVLSSLADDLADIYRSLRAGLEAMRSGAAPEDVMFEWRASFDIHWAALAVGAMGALRAALKNL